MKGKLPLLVSSLLLAGAAPGAEPLGTAISFQGRLDDNGLPANGTYSLRFRLVSDAAGTAQVGPVVDLPNQTLAEGLLNAPLDFGATAFTGDARWLEISVKPGGPSDPSQYLKLNPQPLPPAPASHFSRLAGNVLDGTITGAKLAPLVITATHISDGAITSPKLGPASITSGNVADSAITDAKIAGGQVVKSITVNGSGNLRDVVNLAAGANVTLTPSGNTVTIASSGSGGSGPWSVLSGNAYYNGGSVGIGTSTPLAPLDILGSWTGEQGALNLQGNRPTIRFSGDAASGNQSWLMHVGNTPGNLEFYRRTGPGAWANLLSLGVNGNVGIGGNPDADKKLDVRSASGFAVFARSGFEGVHGETTSDVAAGVAGINLNGGAFSGGSGVYGEAQGGLGVGVWGKSYSFEGVHGETGSSTAAAVAGVNLNTDSDATGAGVYGESRAGRGAGVWGRSTLFEGVHGESSAPNFAATVGVNLSNGGGVYGESRGSGPGVWGVSAAGEGVHGESRVNNFAAVAGVNVAAGTGVYGESRGGGYGGYFLGRVRVGILEIAGGADLAEPFPMKEEAIEKGSVVVIDDEHPGRLKRSTRAYDTRVAGIVSGANGIKPGISLKQEGVVDQGENVALTGRVYVKADASFGAIKPGDLLTTSDTPGHAMKVTDSHRAQGAILGKAMTTLAEGKGMMLVLVTLQ